MKSTLQKFIAFSAGGSFFRQLLQLQLKLRCWFWVGVVALLLIAHTPCMPAAWFQESGYGCRYLVVVLCVGAAVPCSCYTHSLVKGYFTWLLLVLLLCFATPTCGHLICMRSYAYAKPLSARHFALSPLSTAYPLIEYLATGANHISTKRGMN